MLRIYSSKPCRCEFQAQPGRAVEAVGAEAHGAGGLDVALEIVDVQLRAGSSLPRWIVSSKMRGSGLASLTSPETTMSSNQSRNAKRWRAMGKVSADQLVSASRRWPRSAQRRQQLDCFGDLAAQHLRPARVPQGDVLRVLGEHPLALGNRVGKRRGPRPSDGSTPAGTRAPGSPPWPRRRRRTTADTGSAGSSRPAPHPGRTLRHLY